MTSTRVVLTTMGNSDEEVETASTGGVWRILFSVKGPVAGEGCHVKRGLSKGREENIEAHLQKGDCEATTVEPRPEQVRGEGPVSQQRGCTQRGTPRPCYKGEGRVNGHSY